MSLMCSCIVPVDQSEVNVRVQTRCLEHATEDCREYFERSYKFNK